MSKVIILEGPDGAGKTTLAQALSDQHHFSVVRSYGTTGYFPKLDSQQLYKKLLEVILDAARGWYPVVIDRSFMSEWCYGNVMRGKDRLGIDGLDFFLKISRIYDVKQVICLPPWETVLANWTEKRKADWDPEKGTGDYVDAAAKLETIYANYKNFLALDPEAFTGYDYLTDSVESLVA